MKIRDLTESDISDVLIIAHESFPLPWSLKSFLDELKNPKSILKVAEVDEEVVGYVLLLNILNRH